MKNQLGFGGALAAVALILSLASAQTSAQTLPIKYTLTANSTLATCASAGCVSGSVDASTSVVVVTVAAGSSFGGGTLTFYATGDGVLSDGTTVSGYSDAGNPASPSSTITSAGSYTFTVASKTNWAIVLTGATSPSRTLAAALRALGVVAAAARLQRRRPYRRRPLAHRQPHGRRHPMAVRNLRSSSPPETRHVVTIPSSRVVVRR